MRLYSTAYLVLLGLLENLLRGDRHSVFRRLSSGSFGGNLLHDLLLSFLVGLLVGLLGGF